MRINVKIVMEMFNWKMGHAFKNRPRRKNPPSLSAIVQVLIWEFKFDMGYSSDIVHFPSLIFCKTNADFLNTFFSYAHFHHQNYSFMHYMEITLSENWSPSTFVTVFRRR